jgi:LDH2 family malate/lactate/ureidoglycolate dehydrogenase
VQEFTIEPVEDRITCPPMDGFERVYIPGELEAIEEAKRKKTGIPVHEADLKAFFQSLRDHNLEIEEKFLS